MHRVCTCLHQVLDIMASSLVFLAFYGFPANVWISWASPFTVLHLFVCLVQTLMCSFLFYYILLLSLRDRKGVDLDGRGNEEELEEEREGKP